MLCNLPYGAYSVRLERPLSATIESVIAPERLVAFLRDNLLSTLAEPEVCLAVGWKEAHLAAQRKSGRQPLLANSGQSVMLHRVEGAGLARPLRPTFAREG